MDDNVEEIKPLGLDMQKDENQEQSPSRKSLKDDQSEGVNSELEREIQ